MKIRELMTKDVKLCTEDTDLAAVAKIMWDADCGIVPVVDDQRRVIGVVTVNPNMEWYLLAGMSDVPHVEVRLKDQPERGVIGLGEPPTAPTAAAIALAVRNAIGVSVRSLPLTPARVLQVLAANPDSARA